MTALPAGSPLDGSTGAFTWTPGLGFGGMQHLAFVREPYGHREVVRVDVAIQ